MSIDKPHALRACRTPQQDGYRNENWARQGRRRDAGGVVLLLLLLASFATSAPAQQGPALVQPVELCPNSGVLSGSFKVRMQAAPVYDPTTNTLTALPVRTYNLDQTGIWRFCGGQGSIGFCAPQPLS